MLEQGTMDRQLFDRIAGEAASAPDLQAMVFELHNEPFLDRRILAIIKYFKSLNPRKPASIVSNGELIDKFNPEEIAGSGLDRLTISLNAHSRETYNFINRGLDYDRVMNNVNSLVAHAETRKRLALSFVLTNQNLAEVQEAVSYWSNRKVATRVMEVANRAGSLGNYGDHMPDTPYYGRGFFSGLWRRALLKLSEYVGCHLPFYQMNVLFNGDVIICCHDWNRATVVGNVNNTTLKEVWTSDKMNEIRRFLISKKYEQLSSCRGCSLVNGGRQNGKA
jgi:radical SAM protein with 4Fe4S-binding SPASM domain